MTHKPQSLPEIMESLRETCRGLGLRGEGLRDKLNAEYLAPEDKISSSTAMKWIAGENANSRNLLAIQQFIQDHKTKAKQKK